MVTGYSVSDYPPNGGVQFLTYFLSKLFGSNQELLSGFGRPRSLNEGSTTAWMGSMMKSLPTHEHPKKLSCSTVFHLFCCIGASPRSRSGSPVSCSREFGSAVPLR